MEKAIKFYKKYNVLLIGFIIFIFSIILTLNFTRVKESYGNPVSVLDEVNSTQIIEQKFKSEIKNLDSIGITIGTFARQNNSVYEITILDENKKIIEKQSFYTKNLEDNSEILIKFKPQKRSKNRFYTLKITNNAQVGEGITFYKDVSDTKNTNIEKIRINNIKIGESLYISIYGDSIQNIFEYGISKFRFICILFIAYFVVYALGKFKAKELIINKCIIIIIPSLIILFFSTPPTITYDSAHYLSYIPILNGDTSWENWNAVRGLTFPLFLKIGVTIFGDSVQGVLSILFLSYIVFIVLCKKVLYFILADKKPFLQHILLLIFIILNPTIWGAFHSLLTEFIAIIVALASCYIALKWGECNGEKKKSQKLYCLYFILLAPIVWHLKQPYISTIYLPLIACITICVILHWKDKKSILIKLLTLITSVVILFLSIVLWGNWLDYKGVNKENSNSVMAEAIVKSLNLYKDENNSINYKETEYLADRLLTENEKDALNKENSRVLNVYNSRGQVIDKVVFVVRGKSPTLKESLKFCFSQLIKHPIIMMESYARNYMTIADVKKCEVSEDGAWHMAGEEYEFNIGNENENIFYRNLLFAKNNVFDMGELYDEIGYKYQSNYNTPTFIRTFYNILVSIFYQSLYKITIFVLPGLLLLLLIIIIMKRNNKVAQCNKFIFIAVFFASLHVICHCIFVLPIDRYANSAYTIMQLAIIVLLVRLSESSYLMDKQK